MEGQFLTFEGPEGGGKTRSMKAVSQGLRNFGYGVVESREPGGTRIGEEIRNIVLDPRHSEMFADTSFLLFSAARFQHVAELIKPALKQGRIVLCDRFVDSSLALQGYGHEHDLTAIKEINRLATGQLVPDLTLLYDVPVEVGLERKRGQGEWNRLEEMEIQFHERVRKGYFKMAHQESERWVVIDATKPLELVVAESWKVVSGFLAGRDKEGGYLMGKERGF